MQVKINKDFIIFIPENEQDVFNIGKMSMYPVIKPNLNIIVVVRSERDNIDDRHMRIKGLEISFNDLLKILISGV